MFSRLLELGRLFLKLGVIGFGGPAVHIANIEDEVVRRRGWMTHQQFLDMIGVTNLIPGPNSTEMAMHVGYCRAGWLGLIVAGGGFVLPAATMTIAAAWVYVVYGQTPAVEPMLAGIQPAVIAIIFTAGWRLGRKALTGWTLSAIALAVVAMRLVAGLPALYSLLIGSFAGLIVLHWTRSIGGGASGPAALLPLVGVARPGGGTAAAATVSTAVAAAGASYWKLGLFFLKVGAVLYGTGYVLVAYLQDELVGQTGWLTQQQLYDALAVGNLTPGPILCTATFIGFVVMSDGGNMAGGVLGAVVATVAVFLPAFLLVGLVHPLIPRLRANRWTSEFLDAVNAAAIGLLAAVTFELCQATLVAWPQWTIALVAGIAMLRFKLSSAWLVLGGAVAGWLFSIA